MYCVCTTERDIFVNDTFTGIRLMNNKIIYTGHSTHIRVVAVVH